MHRREICIVLFLIVEEIFVLFGGGGSVHSHKRLVGKVADVKVGACTKRNLHMHSLQETSGSALLAHQSPNPPASLTGTGGSPCYQNDETSIGLSPPGALLHTGGRISITSSTLPTGPGSARTRCNHFHSPFLPLARFYFFRPTGRY